LRIVAVRGAPGKFAYPACVILLASSLFLLSLIKETRKREEARKGEKN
jgi:hypothetical protein